MKTTANTIANTIRRSIAQRIRSSHRVLSVLVFIALAAIEMSVHSANVKFLQSIPENGSKISTFDIKLKFDISDIIVETGSENIAVGYSGTKRGVSTYLYEGDEETGTLLANVMTSAFKGSPDSKDYIEVIFPDDIVPKPGQVYTLICKNIFAVYDLETTKVISGTSLSYNSGDPLKLTFIGKAASSEELIFQNSVPSNNDDLKSLNSINFEFNEEIEISQNKPIEIFKEDELITSSKNIKIDPSNSKSLEATFDEITLYLGNQYTIKLPNGVVALKSNDEVVNKPIEIKVNGTSTIRLSTKSVSIEDNSIVLPDNLRIEFNLEEGQTLTAPDGIYHKRSIDFYKDDLSEDNLINTIVGKASGNGITWDLSSFRFEPERKYVLHKKADDITVWENNNPIPWYGNEEVIISFTTPSVEEVGYPPLEFANAILNSSDNATKADYEEDMKCAYISRLDISLIDKKYLLDSTKCNLHVAPDFDGKEVCNLYEITADGDKFLRAYKFNPILKEDATSYWTIYYVQMNTALYEGKKYKFVIPEGYFTAHPDLHSDVNSDIDLSKVNFIRSRELVYTFEGTAPLKAQYLGCNVLDNSEMSSLSKLVWTFDGQYRINESNDKIEEKVIFGLYEGMQPRISKKTPILTSSSDKTYLTLDYVSNTTGAPTVVGKNNTYIFTIPQGMLINIINDEIVNDEIVVTIKGCEEVSDNPKINITYEINGLHSVSHKAPMGEVSEVRLTPDSFWKVSELSLNGEDVTADLNDGIYTTPILTEDTSIKAKLAYNGSLVFADTTTGVAQLPETNVKVYSDGDTIVVEGVATGDEVVLYSISGMVIGRHVANQDTVRITIEHGQYIVRVGNNAANILH